jgi:hypothetical protein
LAARLNLPMPVEAVVNRPVSTHAASLLPNSAEKALLNMLLKYGISTESVMKKMLGKLDFC